MAKKNPWISIKDRMPEIHEIEVRGHIIRKTDDILLASKGGVHFGSVWLYDDGRYTFGSGSDAIETELWTHWMPIPQVPKH